MYGMPMDYGSLQITLAFKTFCTHYDNGKFNFMNKNQGLDSVYITSVVDAFIEVADKVCERDQINNVRKMLRKPTKTDFWNFHNALIAESNPQSPVTPTREMPSFHRKRKRPLWKRLLGF